MNGARWRWCGLVPGLHDGLHGMFVFLQSYNAHSHAPFCQHQGNWNSNLEPNARIFMRKNLLKLANHIQTHHSHAFQRKHEVSTQLLLTPNQLRQTGSTTYQLLDQRPHQPPIMISSFPDIIFLCQHLHRINKRFMLKTRHTQLMGASVFSISLTSWDVLSTLCLHHTLEYTLDNTKGWCAKDLHNYSRPFR